MFAYPLLDRDRPCRRQRRQHRWVLGFRLSNVFLARAANVGDLGQILAILNHEINYGVAHFGTQIESFAKLERDFEQSNRFPWVVGIEGSEVVEFARASPWKARGGYDRTCEVGVYVAEIAQGKGIGRALYSVLVPALEAAGFHTVLAGIALPNEASVRLHERFSFTHVGTLPEVGWKQNRWHDVGYWALRFDEAPRG